MTLNTPLIIKDILGTWKSDSHESEWGPVVFKIQFNRPPSNRTSIAADDLHNIQDLLGDIDNRSTPLSRFLYTNIMHDTEITTKDIQKISRAQLAKKLNSIIQNSRLFSKNLTTCVELNGEITNFLHTETHAHEVIALNRLLLEEAYPKEITRNSGTLKIEMYFSNNPDPMIIEGSYIVLAKYIISPNWNKGEPIKISLTDDLLSLAIE